MEKNRIYFRVGIAAGCTALISGFLHNFLRGIFTIAIELFVISYVIIAVLIFYSLYVSDKNIKLALILTIVGFILSIINDLLYLFLYAWEFWDGSFVFVHLLFISNFLLIGITISNLIKILKSK